jgi:hypothetical protein
MFLQLLWAAVSIGAGISNAGAVQRSTGGDDRAVLVAVLEHTVRPGIALAHGGATAPLPLYVFDQTAPVCTEAPDGYPCARSTKSKSFITRSRSVVSNTSLPTTRSDRNSSTRSGPSIEAGNACRGCPRATSRWYRRKRSPHRGTSHRGPLTATRTSAGRRTRRTATRSCMPRTPAVSCADRAGSWSSTGPRRAGAWQRLRSQRSVEGRSPGWKYVPKVLEGSI